MDRILLAPFRATGRHGVSDEERRHDQTFEVEVACSTDAALAARSDALEETVDYRRLREIALAHVSERSYRLIETLAERIATAILEELRPAWVRVRVTKLRPQGMDVAATIDVQRGAQGPSAPLELHVDDFAPARAFYGALGFHVLREDPGPEGYLVLGNGREVLRLWPGNASVLSHGPFGGDPEPLRPGHRVEIVLTFDDLDAAYRHATALKAVVEPLRQRHWGLRDFRVRDPYGFYVRCTEPHDAISGRRA